MAKKKSSFICSDYIGLQMVIACVTLHALIFSYFSTFSSIFKLSNRNSQQVKCKVKLKWLNKFIHEVLIF
jgi:hypothetical protein